MPSLCREVGAVEQDVRRGQAKPVPVVQSQSNFPLGMRSHNVLPIGANAAPMYAKTLMGRGHKSSQKFTNSFNPDFFVL